MTVMYKTKLLEVSGWSLRSLSRGLSCRLMMNRRIPTRPTVCWRTMRFLTPYTSSCKILTWEYSPIPTKESRFYSSKVQLEGLLNGSEYLDKSSSAMQFERFHTIRTPRLFQLGRPGYADVAVLPLTPTTSKKDTLTILSQLNDGCLLGRIPAVALTEFFQSLLSLQRKHLQEIIACSKFKYFLSTMSDSCARLPQQEFECFLFHLAALRYKINFLTVSKYFKECANVFSQESLIRSSDWQFKQLLKVTDAFSLLGTNNSTLTEIVFQRVKPVAARLTREELLQVIYLAGENRGVPRRLMTDLESRAVTLLRDKDLSFVEIATVCTAFYKSNYKHSSLDFMNLLRDVLFASDLWKHPSYHIVGILKVFRHNYYGYSTLFERLGDQIAKEAHRYPIKSIMQFVLTFATLHIFHKDLMDVASREVLQKIEQCRSKDVAKFIWSFVTLNYEPTDWKLVVDVLQARVEELKDEMETFPIYFISFLLSLAYINVYPSDLLKTVFSDGFLQRIKDYEEREGVDLRSNLYTLHAAVSLESPEKLEQRLNLEYLTSKPFPRQMLGDIREELKQRSELREVADCVKSIVGGNKYYRVHFILPYMRTADIEICLDDTNTPLPLNRSTSPATERDDNSSSSIPLNDDIISHLTGVKSVTSATHLGHKRGHDNISHGRDRTLRTTEEKEGSIDNPEERRLKQVQLPQPLPVSANQRWIAIQVSSRNHHRFGGNKLLGLHSMKRRHLAELGYHVISIPYHDWELVGRHGPAARENYLKKKLFGSL